MPTQVTPAIPASQIVQVLPSVLPAGGNALQLNGMILTQSWRPPIGQVLSFPNDGTSVASYFGAQAQETALATIYFLGPDNSTAKPAALLFAQYPENVVPGYLRGGNISALSLAALQAINATLTVTIDGGGPTSQTVNLGAATSFSNAAVLIAAAMVITGPAAGNITASLSSTTMTVTAINYGLKQAAVTASLSSTTMTVTAVASGMLAIGQVVSGTGITAGTTISALGTGTGGVGTYTLSASASTESAESISAYAPSVTLTVGQVVTGTGIGSNVYISALGTGTGGTGTYTLSASVTTESAEAIAVFSSAVVYDSVLGAFVIYSGTTGAASSVSYGSGAAATSLLLTQATGAVTSAGANAAVPATFMNAITAITQNWASFMTTWEPDDQDKVAFSAWVNGQNNRYHYAMWDTEAGNMAGGGPVGAVASINAANYSGTSLIHENPAVDATGQIAAFVMGWAASLDFTRLNGRQNTAFKHQSGLPGQVFSGTIASYLLSYGMNFYGDYTTANQAFLFYNNGSVSGPFLWLDSYMNQIWLNNQLQLSLMVLLTTVNSIPYNAAGYALIEASLVGPSSTPAVPGGPINQAVYFGAINAGVALSSAQVAEVNSAAGLPIDQTLFQRGWYLQVLPATAQVRAARTSPPCTLWYTDAGSVQKITLASIEVQ